MSGGRHRQMPLKPVGGLHGYGPDGILPYVLLHLEYLFLTVGTRGRHGLVNAGEIVVFPGFREMDVHYRAYNL